MANKLIRLFNGVTINKSDFISMIAEDTLKIKTNFRLTLNSSSEVITTFLDKETRDAEYEKALKN